MFGSLLACMVLASVNAFALDATADDDPWHPPPQNPALTQVVPQPRFRYVGLSFDIGAPDGAALGVVVRPHLNWLRLDLAGTYNGLAPGLRGGLTLDPIKFPMVPTLTLEGGGTWPGKVPGVSNSPEVSYDYVNLHLGIEFGNRDTWRFYLRGGWSYINAQVSDFQNAITLPSGVSIGNPTLSGWVAPSAKLGFAIYF